MKRYLTKLLDIAASLALVALLMSGAHAQVVTKLPVYIDSNAGVVDLGNGPMELQIVQGSTSLFTSQGSGVGSGTTTSVTLTATPTSNPPCVGCILSGTGVTSGTVITAYNGTTGITTNTSQTIAASTALSWGAACPTSATGSGAVQVGAGGRDIPLYTQARICAASTYAPGAVVLPFPIGAH